MKKPSAKILNKIDMSDILSMIPALDTNLKYIDMEAGQEHYRLLEWVGKQVKGSIIELGTFRGHSALCLGEGGQRVVSYDIEDHLSLKEKTENIKFLYSETGHVAIDNSVKLVFLDTMHDGVYERVVLEYLRKINWKGILILDDIVLFPELAKLWEEITERKEDWTDIGHHSGTGVVWFE